MRKIQVGSKGRGKAKEFRSRYIFVPHRVYICSLFFYYYFVKLFQSFVIWRLMCKNFECFVVVDRDWNGR